MSPNIVLVVMDTTRAMSLSCYGCQDKTTPFLDQLSDIGYRHDRMVASSSWTLPAHTSLFTGKRPDEHGITNKTKTLTDEETLAEQLSEAGYTTIGISNNPLVSPNWGLDNGFDTFKNYSDPTAEQSNRLEEGVWIDVWSKDANGEYDNSIEKWSDFLIETVRQRDTDSMKYFFHYLKNKFTKRISTDHNKDDGARKTTEEAKNCIRQTDDPYFLFINYMEAHHPYHPPSEYRKAFLEQEVSDQRLEKIGAAEWIKESYTGEMADEETRDIARALYHSEIRYLDSRIEELYEFIMADDEDTVFIVTSDHGESFGEDGLLKHVGVYQPVNRIPLIATGTEAFKNSSWMDHTHLHHRLLSIAGLTKGDREATYPVTECYGLQSQETHLRDRFKGVKEKWTHRRVAGHTGSTKFVLDGTPENIETFHTEGIEEEEDDIDIEPDEELPEAILSVFSQQEGRGDKEIDETVKKRLKDLGYM